MNFVLYVHDHLIIYPLGWVNKDSISVYIIDEVYLDVTPLDVCGVVFGSPYMYIRDVIFMCREN